MSKKRNSRDELRLWSGWGAQSSKVGLGGQPKELEFRPEGLREPSEGLKQENVT